MNKEKRPLELLKQIGEKAKREGRDQLTDEEIDAEIEKVRREKRQKREPAKTRN